MARTKKTDQKKENDKAVKNTAQQPETAEQAENTAQQLETAEQAENAAQQPEAAEQTEEATRETETPEMAEDDKPETCIKTSPEDAARIAAQVESGNVARLSMNEKGEITLEKPETDVFANLPNPCVYCGPSIKGVARQYTTYQGGITDALREFIKERPEALGLIVSAGRFQAMRRQLEKPGTPEAELYKAVKARL